VNKDEYIKTKTSSADESCQSANGGPILSLNLIIINFYKPINVVICFYKK